MPPHYFFATSLIAVSIIISAQRVSRLALLVLNSTPLVFVASSDVSWPMHLEASLPFQVQSFQKWSAAPLSSFTSEASPPLKYIRDFFPPFCKQSEAGDISGMRFFLHHCKCLKQARCSCPASAFASTACKEVPRVCTRRLVAADLYFYMRGISLNMFHSEVASGQTPAVALSSVDGRPYLFPPLNVFSTLCFYRTVEFISHWFTSISSNLTCSCSEF